MDPNSIFITQSEINKMNGTYGKITYTNILDTIPENSVEFPLKEWKHKHKTEWRWRFLKLPDDRLIVEISYVTTDIDNNFKNRVYFNKKGNWVHREVDPIYDNYVVKQYYYYSSD